MALSDIDNEELGINAISESQNAIVKIKANSNNVTIILLDDITQNEKISINKDIKLILNGKTIHINSGVAVDIFSGNLYIDGTTDGSSIAIESNSNLARTFQVRGGSLTINGGSYLAHSSAVGYSSNVIMTASKVTVKNATIKATADAGKVYAIRNMTGGNTEISNSDIIADAPYTTVDNSSYEYLSIGVNNASGATVTLNDCYVYGTHSGVQNYGDIYVDGGLFESYGHGGIYFSGNESNEAYIKNAELRDCDWKGTYNTNISSRNGSGFYIGGGPDQHNITVYMNNCYLWGEKWAGTLRGSSGETNISLYISNSRIDEGAKFRIDNLTHKFYIGDGCSFAAEDTNNPDAVIITNDTYVK